MVATVTTTMLISASIWASETASRKLSSVTTTLPDDKGKTSLVLVGSRCFHHRHGRCPTGWDFRVRIDDTVKEVQGLLRKVIGEPGQSFGHAIEHFHRGRELAPAVRKTNSIPRVEGKSSGIHGIHL